MSTAIGDSVVERKHCVDPGTMACMILPTKEKEKKLPKSTEEANGFKLIQQQTPLPKRHGTQRIAGFLFLLTHVWVIKGTGQKKTGVWREKKRYATTASCLMTTPHGRAGRAVGAPDKAKAVHGWMAMEGYLAR